MPLPVFGAQQGPSRLHPRNPYAHGMIAGWRMRAGGPDKVAAEDTLMHTVIEDITGRYNINAAPYAGWQTAAGWTWVATPYGWGLQPRAVLRGIDASAPLGITLSAVSVVVYTSGQWPNSMVVFGNNNATPEFTCGTTGYPYYPNISAAAGAWSDATRHGIALNSNPAAGGAYVFCLGGGQAAAYYNGVLHNSATIEATMTLPITTGRLFARYRDVAHWGASLAGLYVYGRIIAPDEAVALMGDIDLPEWQPRRGISLALLGEEGGAVGRPRPYTQHRHGPRLVTGGLS